MELVADLHLHSRFSRAVSSKMNLLNMYQYGKKKGINLLTVADFTHPVWFREIRSELEEESEGIYRIKNKKEADKIFPPVYDDAYGPYFMLTTEIANIYSENGRVYRIHNLVFAPSFEIAGKINKSLGERGFNLSSDGRPILGLSSRNLYDLLFSIDKDIIIIPCHIWTPWFALFGSKSGYDRLSDCFRDYSKYIFAVETGLSSDPNMNWRIKELENRSIVSFSDAHSLEKMGREATVLQFKDGISNTTNPSTDGQFQIEYKDIINAFKKDANRKLEIAYTIEFYPEEGKYHYTGHRNCQVSYSPSDVKEKGIICPVCKRELTVGVMDRVEELATGVLERMKIEKDEHGVSWVKDKNNLRKPFVSIVPLLEIIREALGVSGISNKVFSIYDNLVDGLGSEFQILLKTQFSEIERLAGRDVSEAVKKVRRRDLHIVPGYDGEFGKVQINQILAAEEKDINIKKEENDNKQMGFGF